MCFSIVLFRGKIVIIHIQVFNEDISSLAIANTVKIMLLPKHVDKIAIRSLLWRRPFPVQASIQLPCFPQDRQCSSQRFFDILIFFVQSLGTLPWEITKYLIVNEHSDPIRMICMQAYRLLKKAARPGGWFLVAPTSISSWFLCPRPPFLLCTPNQNRHATQATFR